MIIDTQTRDISPADARLEGRVTGTHDALDMMNIVVLELTEGGKSSFNLTELRLITDTIREMTIHAEPRNIVKKVAHKLGVKLHFV